MNKTSIADTTDKREQQVCTEQYCDRYQQSISEDDFSLLWTERAVEESDTDKPAWAATALVYADGSETTYQRKLIEREDFTATLSTDNDTSGEFVQLMCQRASDQWMDFTSPAEALALAESITAAANKWIEIQAGGDL